MIEEALKSLTDEIKRQNDIAERVLATDNARLTKALADLIDSHIVGRGSH